jgi:sulfatase modifying factor 1
MKSKLFAFTFLIVGACETSFGVTISTVPIGNPDNAPDSRYAGTLHPTGAGSVSYSFRIGKTEISNSQYAEFLNAVATVSDPYDLWVSDMAFTTQGGIVRSGAAGSYHYSVKSPVTSPTYTYPDKPAVDVNWFRALRFVNWLDNGQGGAGTTENGAYTLLGGTPVPSNAGSIVRSPDTQWWIPNDDEWYKAAYYSSTLSAYFDYPTGKSTAPDNSNPAFESGNSANYFANNHYMTSNANYPLADVGSYVRSASPYGTLNQAGNAWEWTETYFGANVLARGGGYQNVASDLKPNASALSDPSFANGSIGFRVATVDVPEPNAFMLTAISFVAATWGRKRVASQRS